MHLQRLFSLFRLCELFKFAYLRDIWNLISLNEGPGTAWRRISSLNVMEIRDRRHANVCKQRTLQAEVDIAPP